MTVAIVTNLNKEAVEQLSAARGEPQWMLERRLHAWALSESLPLPSRSDEAWRRTDISKLKLDRLMLATGNGDEVVESPLRLGGHTAASMQQQNSRVVSCDLPDHVREQGVIFTDLETALRDHEDLVRRYFMTEAVPAERDKFSALNGALWSAGTFLYVPRGVEVALPVRTLYSLSIPNAALFTHSLVILEEGARLAYIEEYASPAIEKISLDAGVVELFVKQNAHLTMITVHEWMGKVYDLSTQRAMLDRDSKIDWLVIGMGDNLTRNNIDATMRGPGSSAQMLGIIWGYGKQHTDYHTVQDHAAPHTTSDLLYKAALTDESRSVFSGLIRVEPGAQGTDAYQTNRSLLLSDKAFAYPSPNLEIGANDVRCSHGASVGRVDEDQLFYLMARGIPKDVATRMIVEGFFTDVLQREPVDTIRDNLADLIDRKLNAGR